MVTAGIEDLTAEAAVGTAMVAVRGGVNDARGIMRGERHAETTTKRHEQEFVAQEVTGFKRREQEQPASAAARVKVNNVLLREPTSKQSNLRLGDILGDRLLLLPLRGAEKGGPVASQPVVTHPGFWSAFGVLLE